MRPPVYFISQVPAHLDRALYIPRHGDGVTHFALYDISKEYFEEVGMHPMGSESYKIELYVLRKPSGYHVGDNARFLVNLDASGTSMSIQERCIGREAVEAEVSLPTKQAKGFSIRSKTSAASVEINGELSYPLPDKHTKKAHIRYPYLTVFTKSTSDQVGPVHLQWQVHPLQDGPLRYELVDLQRRSRGHDSESSILAIYHHLGFESELPTSYSHGALLVPSNSTSAFEVKIVSSLIGVLSSVRQQSAFEKKSRIKSLIPGL
ncbi:hypothetical protein FSARC_10797 [Fusarium sarcochroum]|uniref:Uncharacterized protein n=1 Tax=Fusarium sarcochroum TaxID=1208366 RepID=A0A8H4TJX1_9HYPO|nr:hypothetical protein FSARC_10797 [Fusarium sarcochroum]